MKIFLIGFMGSGKTSIGKRAAKLLKTDFIDLDDEIAELAGMSIPEIFEEQGESGFRELERMVLHNSFKLKRSVIATGGGAPCFFDNMERINEMGMSFYLKHTTEFLVHKLLNAKTPRPLVQGKSEKELEAYINETMEKRQPFYNQADQAISVGYYAKKDTARLIAEFVKLAQG